MSLLDAFARDCVLYDRQRVSDNEGGFATEWVESVEFKNYQALDTSMTARKAEKEGVTSVYSAVVDKSVPIELNDYFRDKESGITYRVTSNPEEREAPKTAGPIIRSLKFFAAERKELPSK